MTFLTMVTQLANGLLVSVEIFVLTLIGSLPLGLLVAFGRMSKCKPLRLIIQVYISIMRGTPLMLQLMVVYFLPATLFGAGLPRFAAVIIGMVLNYAAYFAEIYRGGIESMPVGQYEAAAVLGYSKPQTFCKIILPQVIKHILPSVTNEVITLVKDTSLAYVVSVMEMFTLAKKIASSQTTLMPFVIAGVFYYIFNLVVALIMDRCEKKLSYYR
ncbi:MAG: amino acid ABC transporter permease [Ruminococcaceae bacterium]|nr:amino acid ABC transporter permease [Oscillospiraceae bacterium]